MKYSNTISKDSFTSKAALLISLAVVVFYLLTEHRAHLVEYSNYIILFAFILMHVFMHKGHGGHKGCGGHYHGTQKHKGAEKGNKECTEGLAGKPLSRH
ncbi:MAG: hypothetical protein PWR29_657 [Methanolobus sp.]|jgi:hypothetical protein|nr:hypothetical protein [Methanolobus sp.]